MKKIIVILFAASAFLCNAQEVSMRDYLANTIERLDKIKSATYITHGESQQPGDTLVRLIEPMFLVEIVNPNDTTIGSSFVAFDDSLHSIFNYGYDGRFKAGTYPKAKRIQVYDFLKPPFRPFRPVRAPFFNYVKSILKYTLTTKDSIDTTFKKIDDDYYLKLVINEDKQTEFFGRDYKMEGVPGVWSDPTSQYEIWISSKDGLPFKYKRTQSHDISSERCSDYHLNELKEDTLDMFSFFPADYEIKWAHERESSKPQKEDAMLGKAMPPFELQQYDGTIISSQKLSANVILVEFTGIGCGACVLAMPLLNELQRNYSSDDLQILSIESWGRDARQLGIYRERHSITYPFLVGSPEVQKAFCGDYSAVPAFFLIDSNRKIRYITKGFSREGNGVEMKKKIDALIFGQSK